MFKVSFKGISVRKSVSHFDAMGHLGGIGIEAGYFGGTGARFDDFGCMIICKPVDELVTDGGFVKLGQHGVHQADHVLEDTLF